MARLMRESGIAGIPKKRFRTMTQSNHEKTVAPNLLNRDFTADAPNAVSVGDITYLRTSTGWAYLALLIDVFSRTVVGWAVDSHMRTELVEAALDMAVTIGEPAPGLVHHTDRSVQYASASYQWRLAAIGARPSMSRKGDCWDNAVAESFFGTLEQELVGLSERWRNVAEVRSAVGECIAAFCNVSRRHRTLGQLSPVDFEQRWRREEAPREVA